MHHHHLLLLCFGLVAFAFTGCGTSRDAGLIVTHDGRLVRDTADVTNQEFAYKIGVRAAEGAGKEWKATATIRETPVFQQVAADEFGWQTMSVDLTLVPPSGATIDAAATAQAISRAETAVRDIAKFRVNRTSDIHFATTVKEPGAPLPGSQSYTTVAGDTWGGISTAYYGSPQHWRKIADANPGIDGANMSAGTVLVIPPKP